MFLIIVLALVVVGATGLYAKYVTDKVTLANSTIDKPAIVDNAEGWFQKIDAKLIGWKTIILTWFASVFGVVAAIPSETINTWTGLPWANFVDQKVAAGIAIGLTLLSSVTHANGLQIAASAQPTDEGG